MVVQYNNCCSIFTNVVVKKVDKKFKLYKKKSMGILWCSPEIILITLSSFRIFITKPRKCYPSSPLPKSKAC